MNSFFQANQRYVARNRQLPGAGAGGRPALLGQRASGLHSIEHQAGRSWYPSAVDDGLHHNSAQKANIETARDRRWRFSESQVSALL